MIRKNNVFTLTLILAVFLFACSDSSTNEVNAQGNSGVNTNTTSTSNSENATDNALIPDGENNNNTDNTTPLQSNDFDSDNVSHPLGDPIGIDEAKNSPGIYIMDDELFRLVKPVQVREGPQIGPKVAPPGQTEENFDVLDASYAIPQVSFGAQIVMIGVDSAYIYKSIFNGFTIPPVVIYLYGENQFDYCKVGPDEYEKINGNAPEEFIPNIREFTNKPGSQNLEVRGIVNATLGEEVVFGKFVGTEWKETKYSADQRYIVSYACYDSGNNADFSIERTMNGYFIITFKETPVGYYVIDYFEPATPNNPNGSNVKVFIDFIL